ncbi:AP1M [Lepeophtheirus salmonis]|uniref:AP1M n=1 Tax=Lepeophtheirus salmonis TaxID=72036 RepID=A0A7R8CHB6_LEPSM|nr:AP1M [Lepeophtheirus salmonis]CAF2822947.1 AP1M [Lepeophtheirus salmonis]
MKGKVLINRNYRGDIENNVIEKFIGQTTIAEDEGSSAPLISTSDGVTFAYIKRNNLYVVATTRKNSNIAMIFVLLHKICSVMEDYFKDVEEESIRDNFVIIYELLDELVDFGYPQTTDGKILQDICSTPNSLLTSFFIYMSGGG